MQKPAIDDDVASEPACRQKTPRQGLPPRIGHQAASGRFRFHATVTGGQLLLKFVEHGLAIVPGGFDDDARSHHPRFDRRTDSLAALRIGQARRIPD